ncbi:Retrovirus-related Pol polyprotein from transposon 412 [Frankliniella fusca]|uniref:RNA-directed DNA polymerase n=1 Tax=Frankliniella fusca TaxID=407009 RepID=A0AAE1LQA1_9NEOP|nr:Retrovirus-related Pol polyprotein from transposon 412 [Frankliniella fusca]
MVVAEVEEVKDQPPVTVMPKCLDEQSHREVSCNACSTVTTAPVIKCTVIDQIQCCILDTAAVITVIPRTRDLPVARLRLKGVTSHKANLYGPALTTFTIAGKEFTHMTYEADIKEHLIGIDFLHKYDAVLKIKDEIMNIGQGADRVQIPFTLNESQSARTYVAGKVVYRIRAENSFVLKPFTEKEVKTEFKTDTVADELVRERTNDLPNGNKTRVQDLGGNSLSQGRRRAEAKTAERGGLLNLEEDTMGTQNKNQSQLPGDAKLGLFVSNPAFGNKVSKLPIGVVAQSGLVPCVTAPLTIVMQNFGDKCVTIPKYAVVGEVFVLHPDEYEEGVGEEEKDEEEDECAFVNVINHETVTFEDAEYNTEPSLPEIGEDEDLPKDLQELVSRCTMLSETEKKDLEKLLKKHHDVFAKDNTTFGKKMYHAFDLAHGYHNLEIHPEDQAKTAIILPEGLGLAHRQFEFTRLSFGLSAAPGAFQYIADRIITPAKEKNAQNDLGDTVTCTAMERSKIRMSESTVDVNWTKVIPDGVTEEEMHKAQVLDENLMPIIVAVQERRRPEYQEIAGCGPKTRALWYQFNSLVIHRKLLYRRFEHPTGQKEKEELQLIVPSKYVKSTIKAYHEQLGLGNHFGVSKTLAYLKRFFWWPNMFNDVYEIIGNCKVCARFKGPKHMTKVPLKLFQEGVLHGRWHVDICGPINPKSREGYEYILVAVEAFSGWPVVVPLYKQTADEIAQALITHVFSIFGAPQSILTDQGKAFDSLLFQEIMELYQIKKYRTTAFHPAANGKAERWIKTLKQHLMILIENDRLDWPKYLPFIAQAYRSLPHSSHKFSPYEVMFGAPMRTPLDLDRGEPPRQEEMHKMYPFWVRRTMQDIHETVAHMSKKAAKRMKEYYDRTASLAPFKEGDKVYLYYTLNG